MSGASSDQVLSEAYELIEAEKLEEAQTILGPILEHEPDNVDAWWLYAHAVTDPEMGRMALNQVLRLDNAHREAQDLLAQLDEVDPSKLVSQEAAPPSLPEDSDMASAEAFDREGQEVFSLDDTGPIFDDRIDDIDTPKARRPGLRIALAVLAIVAILILALILLINPFSNPATQTTDENTPAATSIAQQVAPTATAETAPLNALPELGPVNPEIHQAVSEALSEFDLVEGGIGTNETSLGATLLASVCSTGETLRDTLNRAMSAIASASEVIPGDVQAIGVALIDCNADKKYRIIATPTENAVAFSNNEIDVRAFQSGWVAAA